MSSGGHNRKPTHLHMIHGTYRADRANSNEPVVDPSTGAPNAPTHLNKYGKRKWSELAPLLVGGRIMTDLDWTSLEILCEVYGQYREAQYAVYHYTDEDGRRRKRTLAEYMEGRTAQTQTEYGAMKNAIATYKSLMEQFGLSPASRSRVSTVEQDTPADPMTELLERRG